MLSSIFGYPKSTEHPHKLPDLIVKELPEIFVRERPPILHGRLLASRTFWSFFKPPVKAGLFESAYSTVRLCVVNNYLNRLLRLSFSPRSTLKVSVEEGRIIRRFSAASIGFVKVFLRPEKSPPGRRQSCRNSADGQPRLIRANRRLPTCSTTVTPADNNRP